MGQQKAFGWSSYNPNAFQNTIEYAILLANDVIYVHEYGQRKGIFGKYTSGDKLGLERIDGVVHYQRNGVTFYTSEQPSTGILVADVSFRSLKGTITNAKASFEAKDPRRRGGYDVIWMDEIGVDVSGNSLESVSNSSGAASKNHLVGEEDGWIEMEVKEVNKNRYFGWSTQNVDAKSNTIDYGILLRFNGRIRVFEKGIYIREFGFYYKGDIISLERIDGTVYYQRNGLTFYTSTIPSTDSLIVDVTLPQETATIQNARASFAALEQIDEDQDGHSAAVDCDDTDAAINPNATDIPDNGIDEDCDGADATTSTSAFIPDDGEEDTDIRYSDGKVLIGADDTEKPGDYQLYVEKGILTEEVVIAVKNSDQWADDVFEKDYPLKSLKEIATHIHQYQHLPNVPSAKEVEEGGIHLGKMDAILLRQLEEFWLLLIKTKRENQLLKAKILKTLVDKDKNH